MILLLYLAHQPGPRLRWRGVRPKLCLGYGSRRRRLGRRRWSWREDVERAGLEEWQPIAWGIVIPQTFPGTSNSTAIWKTPCRASGRWTHTTRACTECNNLFALRSVTPRVSREFVLSFSFDGNLQPWLLMSRVAVRSQKGCPSKSTPVTLIGTARTIRVLRRISPRGKMPKTPLATDPLA